MRLIFTNPVPCNVVKPGIWRGWAGLLAILLLAMAPAVKAETITFRTVDFKLPLGIAEKIPKSVKTSDIFVSSENCYYVRKDLSFVFIGCVG